MYAELDRLHAEYVFDTIIAGSAHGVDALAVEWAQARGIATLVFTAEGGLAAEAEPVRFVMSACWRNQTSWLLSPAVTGWQTW